MPRYNDIVINQAGHPVPGVTVTVYQGTTSTPAALFVDEGLTMATVNPFTTDGFGRMSFSVSAGDYTIALTGGAPPISSQNYLVSVGGTGGGSGSSAQLQPFVGVQDGANNSYTLTNTPTNPLSVQIFVNSGLWAPTLQYTLVGNVITAVTPLAPDDVMQVFF